MERIEYRYVDKSKWNTDRYDAFLTEPDKVQFEDADTGLPCLIVRGPAGALCGYVGVPESHPLFEKDYDQLYDYDTESGVSISVHGGITFASKCHSREGGLGICHAPAKGESDNVWWFGFDCAHCDDYSPAYDSFIRGGIYRTITYVEREIKSLARQLKALAA